MVTREQVETLYRLILRRYPESSAVVDQWLEVESFSDLLETFVACDEYKALLAGAASHMTLSRDPSLAWPASHIETAADTETMNRIFAHIKEDWTALGESEPYYSVLSNPEYLKDSLRSNTEAFFESGEGDVERLSAFARRARVDLPYHGICLELGCGVGRLTRWLSKDFSKITAVDISSSHIDLARSNLSGVPSARNVDFVQLHSPLDIERLNNFDVLFSVIVMQHNPPPVISYMLSKLLTGLNRGGFAYFQIPTYKLGYSFHVRNYVDSPQKRGEMEMHVLPQSEIFRIGEQTGCVFLEVREDDYTGHVDGVSNTFFLFKP